MFDDKATESRLENGYLDDKSGKVCRVYPDPRFALSSMGYPIGQSADARDLDGDMISHGEGEIIRRNNAGSREEYDAVRKTGFAPQPTNEIIQRTGHRAKRSGAFKHRGSIALDFQIDCDMIQRRHVVGESNDGAQGATIVVHLGLRQVKRVFALNIASAHVIADGVADDLQLRGDDQCQFRFRHTPLAVTADMDSAARTDDAMRIGFEEQLRPRRGIDQIVKPSRAFRLALASLLTTLVSHSGCPHFLLVDRGQEGDVLKGKFLCILIEEIGSHCGWVIGMENLAERFNTRN